MDYLRILLVPFVPSSLLLIGIFALLSWFMTATSGLYGLIGSLFLQTWMFKYCFFLIEHLADGAKEPPVMSVEMLSPLETRPLTQLIFVGVFLWLCMKLDGSARVALACAFGAIIPAQLAVLGIGEPAYQAANPVLLFRLIRGLGALYLVLLAALLAYVLVFWGAVRAGLWLPVVYALGFTCEISFFALIGGLLYQRRAQLGIEPSRSPEREAARAEAQRRGQRDRMIDEVFQLVRIGRHVDATKPLADWIRADADQHLVEDARHIAEQALRWNSPSGLNTVGSTLIRYLMRANRRSDALAVFERLRGAAPTLTLDSAADLRALADYAESLGRKELAQSMRLETPVVGRIVRPDT